MERCAWAALKTTLQVEFPLSHVHNLSALRKVHFASDKIPTIVIKEKVISESAETSREATLKSMQKICTNWKNARTHRIPYKPDYRSDPLSLGERRKKKIIRNSFIFETASLTHYQSCSLIRRNSLQQQCPRKTTVCRWLLRVQLLAWAPRLCSELHVLSPAASAREVHACCLKLWVNHTMPTKCFCTGCTSVAFLSALSNTARVFPKHRIGTEQPCCRSFQQDWHRLPADDSHLAKGR